MSEGKRDVRRFSSMLAACAAAFLSLAAATSAAAASAGLSRDELFRELRPAYELVRNDPAFAARAAAIDRSSARWMETWMRDWPISPLAYLQIDMQVRLYEIAVPRPVFELHQVWLRLHRDEGRRLFGDAAVDRAVSGMALTAEDALAGAGEAPAAPTAGIVGINRNVATADVPAPLDYQGEIQLAVNPHNPQQIVAAANTWDSIGGTCGTAGMQGVFYSGDRGATWQYTCVPSQSAYPGPPVCSLGDTFGSDPAVAWDDAGNVFIEYMMICTNFATNQFAIVVAKSVNGGATWTGQGIVKNSWGTATLEDKNFYAIDVFPTSPFYGRHYTCWDRANNEKSAHSEDGGATWTEVDLPTPGAGNADLGCDLAVGDNGTVHVVFNRLTCPGNCTDEDMYYTRSTDGGVSWSAPVAVHDFNMYGFGGPAVNCPSAQDDRCIAGFGSIDIDNSGGPCRGTLYATFNDFPGGGNANGVDVWVRNSTDNGVSWSAAVKVNDDSPTTANAQFNSFLVVDRAVRRPVVFWQDTRNDAAGDQESEIYVSRSADCGATFEAGTKVTAATAEFANNPAVSPSNENTAQNTNANPNQYGEYNGLDVFGGRVFAAWSDTRQFFPASPGDVQAENLGFAETRFPEVFLDGFETGDKRLWIAVP